MEPRFPFLLDSVSLTSYLYEIGYNSPIPAMIEGEKRNRSSYKRRMEKKGRSGGDLFLFSPSIIAGIGELYPMTAA
jgi:hypothetical protein